MKNQQPNKKKITGGIDFYDENEFAQKKGKEIKLSLEQPKICKTQVAQICEKNKDLNSFRMKITGNPES